MNKRDLFVQLKDPRTINLVEPLTKIRSHKKDSHRVKNGVHHVQRYEVHYPCKDYRITPIPEGMHGRVKRFFLAQDMYEP